MRSQPPAPRRTRPHSPTADAHRPPRRRATTPAVLRALPSPDVLLAERARHVQQHLVAPRWHVAELVECAWRHRAAQALADYARAELRLARPCGNDEDHLGMQSLQRLVAAAGEARVACEHLPRWMPPWPDDACDFFTALAGRHYHVSAHLKEPDPGWHIHPHLGSSAARMRRVVQAADSWEVPDLLGERLHRAEHLAQVGGCLRVVGALLAASIGVGAAGPWRLHLLRLHAWSATHALRQLAAAEQLLHHDGSITRGRPVYLWRRQMGGLAEDLLRSLMHEQEDLRGRRQRLQLEIQLQHDAPPR